MFRFRTAFGNSKLLGTWFINDKIPRAKHLQQPIPVKSSPTNDHASMRFTKHAHVGCTNKPDREPVNTINHTNDHRMFNKPINGGLTNVANRRYTDFHGRKQPYGGLNQVQPNFKTPSQTHYHNTFPPNQRNTNIPWTQVVKSSIPKVVESIHSEPNKAVPLQSADCSRYDIDSFLCLVRAVKEIIK